MQLPNPERNSRSMNILRQDWRLKKWTRPLSLSLSRNCLSVLSITKLALSIADDCLLVVIIDVILIQLAAAWSILKSFSSALDAILTRENLFFQNNRKTYWKTTREHLPRSRNQNAARIPTVPFQVTPSHSWIRTAGFCLSCVLVSLVGSFVDSYRAFIDFGSVNVHLKQSRRASELLRSREYFKSMAIGVRESFSVIGAKIFRSQRLKKYLHSGDRLRLHQKGIWTIFKIPFFDVRPFAVK